MAPGERSQPSQSVLLVAAGMILVAANLRPAVTSVAALLPEIRGDLGLSATAGALLTAAPVLCFGLLAPAAPRLAGRLGMERSLAAVLALIGAGLLVRVAGGAWPLFAGTILVAGAIAVGNVLLPALIKRDFPGHAGSMTGAYVTALSVTAAAAAGLSVPIATGLGTWRAGLVAWAALAALAFVVWLPQLPSHTRPASAGGTAMRALVRERIAWFVTLYFGIQSLLFYATASWLPTIYQDAGLSASDAGYLLATLTLLGVPASLVVPTLAARAADQRAYVLLAGGLIAVGFGGVLLAPLALPWVWVSVLGLGLGASFPLALTLLVLRTRTPGDTARLSAMAQSLGYVVAALGPFLMGILHDLAQTWQVPLAALLALVVPQVLFGLGAARHRFVGDAAAG